LASELLATSFKVALTNILGKIKTSEKKERKTFFALEIESDTLKSAVWEVVEGKAEVVKIGTVEEWDEKKDGSFLVACDRTISSASAGITPEPDSVIFGLPEDWVVKDQIAKDKKRTLKQVCRNLELKPLGFVATIEALVTFLKKKQGTPPSAILIRMAETEICLSLVVLGKVVGSQTVVRSEDLAADVKEGLARFEKVENLPPRMILFDSLADFEEAKQQLISYEWDKELPFLHFPKVESLAVETSIRAIAVAGGSEVAKSLGFEIEEEKKEVSKEKDRDEETEERAAEEVGVVEDKEEEELKVEDSEVKKDNTEELGFVAGGDVLKKVGKVEKLGKEKVEKKAARVAVALNQSKHDLGRAPVEKVAEKGKKHEELVIREMRGPDVVSGTEISRKTSAQPKREGFLGRVFSVVKLVPQSLFSIRPRLPKFKKPGIPFSGLPATVGFIVFIFICLFVGGLVLYWRLPKAKVIVFIKPEILEKEISLTVSSAAAFLDKEDKIIPGKTQTIEASSSETISTSGKKLVGDKANGEATIFNKTDSVKSFEERTVLVGPNNLSFEILEDVEVASKSAETTEEGETITYGKATVGLEAASIGPEYNLEAGTEFSFKDFGTGSFSAKTESGLSGGTSREIKAVSEEDQEALLAKLTEKLEAEAAQKLEEKLPPGQKVFAKGMEKKVKSKEFNHDVDDEADKLSLDLSLQLTALSFAKEDLDSLLFHVLSDQVPDNFELRPTDLETEIKDVEASDEEAEFEVQVKAELLPRYDIDELTESLVGKYPQVAEETLSSLPNFARAVIEISPKLPGKLGTLPRLKENIEIEFKIAE